MTEDSKKAMIALDDAADEAGGYVVPNCEPCEFDLRRIIKYAQEKGIRPDELTDEEREQFRLR